MTKTNDKQDIIDVGDRVRILKHRHAGWTGKVVARDPMTGWYTLRLQQDADGEELAYNHFDGPYTRKELSLLKGSSPCPTFDATDGVPFLEGGAV